MDKQELKNILEEHKKWLDDNKTGKRANLSGASLSDANLSGTNLIGADLSGANMENAKLYGYVLKKDNEENKER